MMRATSAARMSMLSRFSLGCILQAHRSIMAELHLAVGFKSAGRSRLVSL